MSSIIPNFIKTFSLFVEKILDFFKSLCYNIVVSWRDGRVGLRRTTGNRVYPNRYQGFESLSLRQKRSNFCLPKVRSFLSIAKAMVYHHALACISSPKVYIISRRLYFAFAMMICKAFRFDDMQFLAELMTYTPLA